MKEIMKIPKTISVEKIVDSSCVLLLNKDSDDFHILIEKIVNQDSFVVVYSEIVSFFCKSLAALND